MNLYHSVRRVLGVRRSRALPPRGPRPRLGARIVNGDLRMTTQAGLTDSVWNWLIERGWREEAYRGDRRVYRELPPSLVAALFDSTDSGDRERLLELAIAEAESRPVVTLQPRR
jgi:hypothetical protein